MNPTKEQRRDAYREARRAIDKLDRAARELGASDCHDLASKVHNNDLDRRLDDGIRAITNAHSYLNNGGLEGLVKSIEDEE